MNSDLHPYLDETTNNSHKSDMALTTKTPAKDSAHEVRESYQAKESIISDEIVRLPSTEQPNFSVDIRGKVSPNQSELSNPVLGYRFSPAMVKAKTKRAQYQMQLQKAVITQTPLHSST